MRGGLFLVTPRPIERLTIAAPETARTGAATDVEITVGDSSGTAVSAVIPLRVEIIDSAGRIAERSGFYGAVNGLLKLRLEFARNDAPGAWQIRVEELASGQVAKKSVRVRNIGG